MGAAGKLIDMKASGFVSLPIAAGAAADEPHDVAFDPVRHSAPGIEVWPHWLRDLRALA